MLLKDVIKGTDCVLYNEAQGEVEIFGISSDSRRVSPGDVFVCIKGRENDGAKYVKEARRRGARVIVCDKNTDACKAIKVVTERAERTLAIMLSNLYCHTKTNMKVIGITGTNGKTTVTHLIAHALNKLGHRCARIGTLGAEFENEETEISSMTTPDAQVLYPLLKRYAQAGAEYAVMEVSSHSLALEKVYGIRFAVAGITNITPEHLDFHGNMQNYTESKRKLFELSLKSVVCEDDIYTSEIYRGLEGDKVSCSIKNTDADYYAYDIISRAVKGSVFTVNAMGKHLSGETCVPGEFSVSNYVLAMAVLCELGIEAGEACKALDGFGGVKGRMELIETGREYDVIIDFAHTPDALSKLLSTVRAFRKGQRRIVTLFGCGGERDRSKRSLMGAIASHLSDMVIITSDNCRSEDCSEIIDEIMLGFDKSCAHVRIENRKAAIEYALQNAMEGDIILLCGKGHEEYQIDKNGKRYFSEHETVREILSKKDRD